MSAKILQVIFMMGKLTIKILDPMQEMPRPTQQISQT